MLTFIAAAGEIYRMYRQRAGNAGDLIRSQAAVVIYIGIARSFYQHIISAGI